MNNNAVVGLDWDNMSLPRAKERQSLIEREQKVKTLLYKTKHGFHLEIFYNYDIAVSKNFSIRTKYWDDKIRLKYSKRRYSIAGSGHDILFTIKNGRWRVPIC